MNQDKFNMELRKFLKKVGITSQREIEQAVQQAISAGNLKGNEAIHTKMTLSIASLDVNVVIEGTIELD